MKKFNIPNIYKSSIIKKIKEIRLKNDPSKNNLSPTILDFGKIRFYLARHFGFCFGVENAIEISYKALKENPNKKIYLLSQMIHNADVNNDLQKKGIRFIMDTQGNQLINWNQINSNDIVIIPAFGTTQETLKTLESKNISTKKYNTTCPFVTRVWKRADQLGKQNYTIIIHGKHNHEETKATYSFSKKSAPSLIIKNLSEAKILGNIILGIEPESRFFQIFKGKYSKNFNPKKDLDNIGVINQTTMLAIETKEISNYLKSVIKKKFGEKKIDSHIANTRDTLCYATNENQQSTYELLNYKADLAFVVGGYNSSNTSHLVELCESKIPTYFISNSEKILSKISINHHNFKENKNILTENYLPQKSKIDILLTSGASCPDTVIEEVLVKILSFYNLDNKINDILKKIEIKYDQN